ncbi:MAG TPA: hypothetical protein VGH82_10215 [Gaiellaceae bacterium]|jgi:hypothetical protein
MTLAVLAAAGAAAAGATTARAVGTVGTSFPPGFPTILDASLGTPVLGFGAAGPVVRTPVIFLHGNNDTPFPTACNPYGAVHTMAQYFADHGYAPSELWALGYQGDQCDLLTDPTNRSGVAHTTLANIPDLDRFVRSVLAYTGARRVDIIGHSLGVTLARAWMKLDHTGHLVRRFVGIDGPNHGITDCSPSPLNFWQLPANGGFTPDSAICEEYGSDHTPFLHWLNRGQETPGPTRYLVIRNVGPDFVYSPLQDGLFPGVPAEDRDGLPHDFLDSAQLDDAAEIDLIGQGVFDPFLGTAHLGILNSPRTWAAALAFLTS